MSSIQSTATTAATHPEQSSFEGSSISSSSVLDKIRAAIESLEHDCIADVMRKRGFDPEKGCLLLIPYDERLELCDLPHYVRPSGFVKQAFLVDMSSCQLTRELDRYMIAP